ncbi:hypothetical protein ATI02_1756 [Pseudomonas baetica]|uniref:Uncharacterized protein n=1 Tax=Pseudomonas baetica TaxID=674054 RepID=A0ABX4PXZ5_9PSED|nr:hypothetical protein [Pseudomonas baetica]PKA68947.1 hypothetical protein ATI02_1756 [Pseudomonas baetica]
MININISASAYKLSRGAPTKVAHYDSLMTDRRERLQVIDKLTTVVRRYAHAESIVHWDAQIFLAPESALHNALKPGIAILQEMTAKVELQLLLGKLQIPSHAVLSVTASGQIDARFDGQARIFSHAEKLAPTLQEDLQLLYELAELAGGSITLDDHVDIVQWLKFHQFNVPQTAMDAQRLLAFLQYEYPASPPLGNYWEMLNGNDVNAKALLPEQRNQIRALTRQYTGGQPLLSHLADIIHGGRATPFKRSEAQSVVSALAASPIARRYAETYLRDLDWFGARDDQRVAQEHLQQLLLTAIVLDLYPACAEDEPRNHVAGFNLYAAEHMEMTFADVHTKLEEHLLEHCAIGEMELALASHLLLASKAPEFLVKDLPPTLFLGTPQWVDYCRAVATVEIGAPGASRLMNYQQVLDVLSFASISESQQALNALASVDPVVDWALLNSIISLDETKTSLPRALEKALSAYERYAQSYTDTANTLSRPLPTRRAIALDILKHVAPGCSYLEDEVVYQVRNRQYQDSLSEPLAMSLVDLHMSNDLAPGDWDVKQGTSLYTAYPGLLRELVSAQSLFHRQFHRDYVPHTEAMATHLKLAFSSIPKVDRERLLQGRITLFTVRSSAAIVPTPSMDIALTPFDLIGNVIDAVHNLRLVENQQGKDAATGRYGVVICASVEGQVYCYELFTLQGKCLANPALGKLINDAGLLKTPAREDFTGNLTQYGAPAALINIPTNVECYTHGVPPGFVAASQGIIEKLAVLPALNNLDIQPKGYYQSFFDGDFDRLANFVLKHRPIATYDELVKECWGHTRLEKLRAKREADLDTLLNIIVPFKSCIEDIASGDTDRQLSGAKSCILEAAMTLLLVVAVVGKIVTIGARTASLASKSFQLAKASIGFINAVFNPLDGWVELAQAGQKMLGKGVSRFGRAGQQSLEIATFQIRRLTGHAQSYDLIKAAERTDIAHGIWRPSGAASEPLTILATRYNDDWYALNRFRQPWGEKLRNFDLNITLPRPHWNKILPNTYARAIIKKSLPVASQKVDDAIKVLDDPNLISESGIVLELLLGDNSVDARRVYRQYLTDVKTDLSLVEPKNIQLDSTKNSDAYAALEWGKYNDWKNGDRVKNAENPFIHVYTRNFNDAYRNDHFNPAAAADIFVHEIFHGTPRTKDFAYALDTGVYQKGYQQLDSAPLLNLANGMVSMNLPSFPDVNYNRGTALKNADSFSLATSLLSQLKTNKPAYQQNVKVMREALERARYGFIHDRALIKLNIL